MQLGKIGLLVNLALLFSVPVSAGPYAIEIRDAPIADVMRLFAYMQKSNIVVPSTLEETVTASFPSIELHDAMSALLESKNLGIVRRDAVIRVLSKKDMEALGQDLVTNTYILKYAKARDIRESISALISPRGSITLDERTNTVIVRDTAPYIKNITSLVTTIDIADRQVLIEARIVEAATDFSRSLGIQWGLSGRLGMVNINGSRVGSAAPASGGSTGSTGIPGASAGPPASGGGQGPNFIQNTPAGNPLSRLALGIGPFLGGASVDIALSAGEQSGKLSILSRPSIVTMNNKPARIRSGIKLFVKVPGSVNIGASGGGGASAASGSNLKEIEAGITMTVTPQITVDNKINLTIDVTESQPNYSKEIEGVPSVIDNTATTTLLLENGETTVIGGLFQVQDSANSQGLPILHRIPILGRLFGSATRGRLKKELLIFIKPSIISDALKSLDLDMEPNAQETEIINKTFKDAEKLKHSG